MAGFLIDFKCSALALVSCAGARRRVQFTLALFYFQRLEKGPSGCANVSLWLRFVFSV